MPITIKTKADNASSVLAKLGVPAGLISDMQTAKVVCAIENGGFQFTPEGQKAPVTTVPVKLTQMQQLLAGKLGQSVQDLMKSQLSDAIVKAVATVGMEAVQAKPGGTLDKLKQGVKDAGEASAIAAEAMKGLHAPLSDIAKNVGLDLGKDKDTSVVIPVTKDWPLFDIAKIKTAATVQLRDATKMYQPVKGTSGGSRYFMVAANKDVRVGCRYRDDTLSVRIEGEGWGKYAKKLSDCGFDNVDPKKQYASLHLSVANKVVAAKALGAILLGMGIPLETPLPDIEVVALGSKAGA